MGGIPGPCNSEPLVVLLASAMSLLQVGGPSWFLPVYPETVLREPALTLPQSWAAPEVLLRVQGEASFVLVPVPGKVS